MVSLEIWQYKISGVFRFFFSLVSVSFRLFSRLPRDTDFLPVEAEAAL
jgi:hypothetical protein